MWMVTNRLTKSELGIVLGFNKNKAPQGAFHRRQIMYAALTATMLMSAFQYGMILGLCDPKHYMKLMRGEYGNF